MSGVAYVTTVDEEEREDDDDKDESCLIRSRIELMLIS